MKSVIALLVVVVVGLASAAQDDLMCKCTKMYTPICGSDGNTYNNLCLLKCHQKVNKGLTGVSIGRCEDQKAYVKEPMCPCPRIYMPICGSDGVTYNNYCLLKCQQQANNDLTVVHKGRCEEQVETEVMSHPCMCTMEYMPVCGSDGVTYGNKCTFRCQQSQSNGLVVAHQGECQAKVQEDACICTMEYAPICGSDGVTYGNMCEFRCKQKNNKGLAFAFAGECQKANVEEVGCFCTLEYAPVCGSDGLTYPSMCNLKCHQKNNQGLSAAYKGECQKAQVQEDVCICTMEYAPVCGSDGVTYGNMCGLQCKQRNNNGLTLAHKGQCQMQEPVCVCTLEYAPVCGSDGVTYPNMCNLKCKQRNNSELGVEHTGVC